MDANLVSSEIEDELHNNSTINLDDSNVLSSTKQDSSVLEISSSSSDSSHSDDIVVVEDDSDADTINVKEEKEKVIHDILNDEDDSNIDLKEEKQNVIHDILHDKNGDSIDVKEEREKVIHDILHEDDDLKERNIEVCSSSDEDNSQNTTEEQYVTSVQSPFQLSVNPGGDTNLTAETNSSADTNDASQLLSSVDTTAVGNHSTLGASDLEAFQNELSSHPMKVPELVSEGLGEKEVLANEVNDELYNSILTTSESKLSGMKVNDDVEEDYNIEEVTNACLTLSLNDDNVVVEKIDKNSSLESEKQATDGTVKAVIEEEKAAVLNGDVIQKIEAQEEKFVDVKQVAVEANVAGTDSSPKKRKAEEEALSNSVNEVSINKSDLMNAASVIEGVVLESSDGEKSDVEDNDEDSESDMMRIPTGLPSKRQRIADPDLPKTVQVLHSAKSGAKVYLIGTAHFSKQSCEDVAKVIEGVQPDIVMIELCEARTNMLHLDEETILEEAKNLNFEKSMDIMKQQGAVQRVGYGFGWRVQASFCRSTESSRLHGPLGR